MDRVESMIFDTMLVTEDRRKSALEVYTEIDSICKNMQVGVLKNLL